MHNRTLFLLLVAALIFAVLWCSTKNRQKHNPRHAPSLKAQNPRPPQKSESFSDDEPNIRYLATYDEQDHIKNYSGMGNDTLFYPSGPYPVPYTATTATYALKRDYKDEDLSFIP